MLNALINASVQADTAVVETALSLADHRTFTQYEIDTLQSVRYNNVSVYKWLCLLETMAHADDGGQVLREMNDAYGGETLDRLLALEERDATPVRDTLQSVLDTVVPTRCFVTPASYHNVDDITAYRSRRLDLGDAPTRDNDDVLTGHLYRGVPVLHNKTRLLIASLLNVPPHRVWYPCDNEGYNELRSTLCALLTAYGVDVDFGGGGGDDYRALPLAQFCGRFIQSIPQKLTADMVRHFVASFPNSDGSALADLILDIVSRLERATPFQLSAINDTILATVARTLGDHTACTEIGATSQEEGGSDPIGFNRHVVYGVLSKYGVFFNTDDATCHVSDFKVCPVRAKVVLNTFNYYRNRRIVIADDDKITLVPVALQPNGSGDDVSLLLDKLKRTVAFDGDYATFQTVLRCLAVSEDAVLHILAPIIYNVSGLACCAIAAELYAYHFGVNTKSQAMYHLLSTLRTRDIESLDNLQQNACKLTGTPESLLLSAVFGGRPRLAPVLTVRLEKTIDELRRMTNDADVIAEASQSDFHEYEIAHYWALSEPIDERTQRVLKALLLFSNTSRDVKTWIYRTMDPQYVSLDAIRLVKKTYETDNLLPVPLESVYNVYAELIRNQVDICRCVPDLIDYVKQTRDCNLLQLVDDQHEIDGRLY